MKGYLVTFQDEPTTVYLVGKTLPVWRVYANRRNAEGFIKDCVNPSDFGIVEFDLPVSSKPTAR